MGISASGYLGGKLLRAPGPVISQLLVTAATPPSPSATVTINLKGENLSKDATIKVDADELRKDQFQITPLKTQEGASDPSFCRELTVTLTDAANYLVGSHALTLTNKDGQMAVSTFPLDTLSIDSSPPLTVPAGTAPTRVTLTGRNFAPNMTVHWIPQGAAAPPNPAAITKQSATQFEVSLTPGNNKGTGTLILISAIGLRASAPVEVQ
jgi:hypothetical protein